MAGGLPYAKRLLGYGLGDFGLNIYWNALSLLLVFWYTSFAGLEPQLAGLIYAIGLFWDAISDPIAAGLTERTRTRFGSYRPYIAFGSFALGLAFCLLFWVPPVGEGMVFWVLLLTNIIFRTCYTLVAVPYAALSSRITFDSEERGDLTGVRMTFAFLGQFCVASLAFPVARYFSELAGEDWGFFYAAMIGAAIATIVLLTCALLTRELPLPAADREAVRSGHLFRSFGRAVANNRALRVLMVVICLNVITGTSQMIPLAYYVKANGDAFAPVEYVLGAFSLAMLSGTIVWTFAIRSFGKRLSWYAAAALQLLMGASLLAIGPFLISGLPTQIILYGFCTACYAVIVWSVVPNIVEYGQHAYGERAEGAVFGLFLLVQKSSGALAGLVVGLVLSWVGFEAGAIEPSVEVARNLEVFLALVPPIASVLAAAAFTYMPLNRRVHADIVGELAGER